ncbi:hypothetical protein [Acidithiobacillus albertensis]|uniref:hypothetical protein n=1 Tax=Acidithiobacillus albertensis TaxID=119978 RepID=UPI00094AB555|nr:hypothetical protein [Acidithiobacillus albertensis]
MSHDSCLTATEAFQILIQSTADATDRRVDGEKIGIVKQWMNYDEAIAIVLALRVTTEYELHFSPKLMMSLLMNFCRDSLADAYADFACQLLGRENIMMTPSQLKDNPFVVLIDINDFAISGRNLGFKPAWNPFREPFSTQWRNGLA